MAELSDLEQGAAGVAHAIVRGGVSARFECSRSQHGWQVRTAVIREGLARPYRIEVSLVTTDLDADPDELLGSPCEFAFDRSAQWRTFFGVVVRVKLASPEAVRVVGDTLAVDLEIAPALATMSQRINCRIFQDLTVPEILRDVLLGSQVAVGQSAEGLAAFGRTIVDSDLALTDYQPPRDYCVQYRESDLDFVRRLMHEEGIVFVFDQEGEHEVLRLVDSEATLPLFAGVDGARLPIDPTCVDERDVIRQLVVDRAPTSTRIALHHHDWLQPTAPVRHAGAGARLGPAEDTTREVYLPSERRVREVSDGGRVRSSHDDSQRRLDIGLAHLLRDDFVARGTSNAVALGAGSLFEIDQAMAAERLVVLDIMHELSVDTDAGQARGSYENHFVAVPSSRFRAALSEVPRPLMRGPQTATVTGPENEDIHTDAFGRIKILMHWDRDGEGGRGRARRADASSSVWVRVAQAWAGAGWGALFLPRVGMEVMVDFLDGNPDRPIVSGCLYNGSHPPPYPLPDERTRSTIRTWSTPHTGGYNEIRFEDSAEREELMLRAQRDMNELVLRNHGTDVKVDQTHKVGNDRTRTVGRHESITVTGNRTLVVDGEGGQGFSGESIKVTNDYKLDVTKTILVQAPVEILIRCEGSTIRMTPDEIVLQAGGGAKIVLNKDALVESKDGSRAFFDADIDIAASTGARGKLDADVRLTAKDKGELLLTKDAKITSGDKAHALFEAEKITIESGEATIVLDKKKIEVDAEEIDAKAEKKMALEGGGGRVGLEGGKAQVN